jgi:hypothetical protein
MRNVRYWAASFSVFVSTTSISSFALESVAFSLQNNMRKCHQYTALDMHHAALSSSSEACGNSLARDILRGHTLTALTVGSEGIMGQGKAYQPVENSPEGWKILMQAVAGGLLS